MIMEPVNIAQSTNPGDRSSSFPRTQLIVSVRELSFFCTVIGVICPESVAQQGRSVEFNPTSNFRLSILLTLTKS